MSTSKTTKILLHLQKYKTINTWDAFMSYGVTRLSSVIFNLRKTYNISATMHHETDPYGNAVCYAEYKYLGEIPDDKLDDATKASKARRNKRIANKSNVV